MCCGLLRCVRVGGPCTLRTSGQRVAPLEISYTVCALGRAATPAQHLNRRPRASHFTLQIGAAGGAFSSFAVLVAASQRGSVVRSTLCAMVHAACTLIPFLPPHKRRGTVRNPVTAICRNRNVSSVPSPTPCNCPIQGNILCMSGAARGRCPRQTLVRI